MSTVVFPSGNGTLTSTALVPVTFQNLLQPVIAQCLGLDPVADPKTAFYKVRVGWQQEGQPAWKISEDVCILRAVLENADFARVRDELFWENTDSPPGTDLTKQMGFTQVWNLHLTFYGPNCEDHARLVLSAMTLDWVHDILAASDIYRIPATARPTYLPENFQGQWWPRADVEIQFNEEVTETITAHSAASVDVTVVTDKPTTATIHIAAP